MENRCLHRKNSEDVFYLYTNSNIRIRYMSQYKNWIFSDMEEIVCSFPIWEEMEKSTNSSSKFRYCISWDIGPLP